jgi:hypothetical protein
METEVLFQRDGAHPPEATVVFPVCNQAPYVAEAALAALAQEGVALELLFSDDASNDRTVLRLLEVVRSYRGPHAVVVRRNTRRLGMDHVVALVEAATADLHLMAHGDDIMRPGRCARTVSMLRETGASVLSINACAQDELARREYPYTTDRDSGFLSAEEIARAGWLRPMLGATLAWRREVYTAFPRLDAAHLPTGHDYLVPFRGALLGGMYFLNEQLIDYRIHAAQWSRHMYGAGDPRVRQDFHDGRSLSAQLAMLRDLEHRRATHPAEATRLSEIEAVLREACWGRLQGWMQVRDELYREGHRAHWLTTAALRRAYEAERWARRWQRLKGLLGAGSRDRS